MSDSLLDSGTHTIDVSAGMAHYAADGEGAIPRIALCGAPLRGVRSNGKPPCFKCATIRSAEWQEILHELFGPGAMN